MRTKLEAGHILVAVGGACEHLSPFVHCNSLSPSTPVTWSGEPVMEESNVLGGRVAAEGLGSWLGFPCWHTALEGVLALLRLCSSSVNEDRNHNKGVVNLKSCDAVARAWP